ncbi:unnamed protein product [Auanema sp. JU1783]|nr:unnamed protein product [Auanema sp. JU1783]
MERRVFVSGLGFDITEAELRSYFERYGPMTEFKLLRDKNGDSRGLAFVAYQKEISLYKCVNEVSHRIGERAFSVKETEEEAVVSNIASKKLYISLLNLPNVSEDIIRSWFADCGQVQSIAFSPDNLRSYCIVTFTTENAVDLSLTKLYTIGGKPLFTRKAISREDVKKADQWEKERAAREEKMNSNPAYRYLAAKQAQEATFYSSMPSLLGSTSVAPGAPPAQQAQTQPYPVQTHVMASTVRQQGNYQNAYHYHNNSNPSNSSNAPKSMSKYGYY